MATYGFLCDTYRTEILKIGAIWRAFPGSAMDFRPHPRSRSVIEHMEHQCESEGRWMRVMLGIDTGDPMPAERTRSGFLDRYEADARRRLDLLQAMPDTWWTAETGFFDVRRSRAWVFTRRITHSAHHRGQLVVSLRLLGIPQPSVYGPTADTGGRTDYSPAP